MKLIYLLQCNSFSEALVLSYKHPIVAINSKLARNQLELLFLTFIQEIINKSDLGYFMHEYAVWILVVTLLTDPRYISFSKKLVNILYNMTFCLKYLILDVQDSLRRWCKKRCYLEYYCWPLTVYQLNQNIWHRK